MPCSYVNPVGIKWTVEQITAVFRCFYLNPYNGINMFSFVVLDVAPGASCMLGEHSTTPTYYHLHACETFLLLGRMP